MKTLRNEKGFALAFVLILAVIALVFTIAMLTMVGRGSFLSGQQKRYRTAVEAGHGGAETMLQMISSRGYLDNVYNEQFTPNSTGLNTKLGSPTGVWIGLDNTTTIDPNTPSTYDMRVHLGTYLVYTKIADTVEGNSGADEGLLKESVVNTGSGEVTVVSVPYLYTIEVLSQADANPTDRSRISVLYQY
ncbi:MAG: hypothetical protein HY896_03705 [Deltaproteobacteria bacterium]|nr:hypothetical protein [Deltaproteobacteria bacterium]